MKKLIVLFTLISFLFAPFYTNASNIDYSKTEIKVSGKNYTLTKVKDLLYKNITNRVNKKQSESSKIEAYNSFLKALDKIIIQAKKSKKIKNIHLGYMLEDLKQSLVLDLGKITNKTSQNNEIVESNDLKDSNIEKIKEKYQNSVGNITLSDNFEILNDPYIERPVLYAVPGLTQAIKTIKTEDITNNSSVSKVMSYEGTVRDTSYNMGTLEVNIKESLKDLVKINKSYFLNPTFSFDYVNPLLTNINIDKNELKSFRAFVSDNGKSKLVSVNFLGKEGDYSNMNILEKYENGKTLAYGKDGVIYNQGVKISSDFKIETSLDNLPSMGVGQTKLDNGKTIEEQIQFYKELVKTEYGNKIDFGFSGKNLVDRDDNKLVNGINQEAITKQRIESSENGKAKIIGIKLNTVGDGLGVEIIEYYDNGKSFGFGYTGMGYSEASKTSKYFREIQAQVTRINGKVQQQNLRY